MAENTSISILQLVQSLEMRLDKLIVKNQNLKRENDDLRLQLEISLKALENQEINNIEVEQQNKILKIAQHLSTSKSADTRLLKYKINELVRDIDKCIAGLSD